MSAIAWSRLCNPVVQCPEWSLKDACVIEHDGYFHLFSSAFDEERSSIIHLRTRDWRRFSDPLRIWTGTDLDAVGVCSPNIIRADDGSFILHFNTWGEPKPVLNQLFACRSTDLQAWSPPQQIAAELTAGIRCIDIALAQHGGRWFAAWKAGATCRVAAADGLDGPWAFVDGGRTRLLRQDGSDFAAAGGTHENVQLWSHAGRWYLLSTDYEPHDPWLYRLDGDPDDPVSWGRWVDGQPLRLPSQPFNSIPADEPCVVASDFRRPLLPCWDDPADSVRIVDGLANAPFLFDHGDWTYLLYAGKNEERRNDFNGRMAGGRLQDGWPRGWNRLALARSRDLQQWAVPPQG